MARPPHGRLPGTDPTEGDASANELPLDLSRGEPRRARRLFGPPVDGRIEPRFNPAQLSDDLATSRVADAADSMIPPPSSLGSIGGPDIASDPFAYHSMTPTKDDSLSFPRDRQSPTSRDTQSRVRATPDKRPHFDRGPQASLFDAPADASQAAPTPDVEVEFRDALPNRLTTSDMTTPSLRAQEVDDRIREPMRRTLRQEPADLARARMDMPLSGRLGADTPLQPQRERPISTRSLNDMMPSDVRVTRNAQDASFNTRNTGETRRTLDLSDRTDLRFDSASDEALTRIDPTIPALIANRKIDDLPSTRSSAQLSSPLNHDWERGDAMDPMDALTSRMRHRAMDDTERLSARRNEAIIEQARDALSVFGMKVDEVRVARAEARFKPKAPTTEDLIAQSRVDAIDEEQALLEAEEDLHEAPLVARRYGFNSPGTLTETIASRFQFLKLTRASRAPKVLRVSRRKRQSRLYEDVVAWIVVPPFIIGMIYGILELSNFLANSPLGKLLSGS